jgi:hypothetical protein
MYHDVSSRLVVLADPGGPGRLAPGLGSAGRVGHRCKGSSALSLSLCRAAAKPRAYSKGAVSEKTIMMMYIHVHAIMN